MIEVTKAEVTDSESISNLLDQLGYPNTSNFMEDKIKQLLEDKDEELLVAKIDNKILGVISIHFIPQLSLKGDFCRISYFCIDKDERNKGIGALLESHAVKLAKQRECDRIEVHCHERREEAHKFYFRQGYEESPKYLMKILKD